jgi:hypothetical protein
LLNLRVEVSKSSILDVEEETLDQTTIAERCPEGFRIRVLLDPAPDAHSPIHP